MTGDNNKTASWSYKDALALGLVVVAHGLALWQFTRVVHPMATLETVPLEVSLVIPPDEPPPPEPPKPPPPREQPKPPPKQIPKPTPEPPPVIVETPVAKPIVAPPLPPPTPPAPAPPAAKPTSGSSLQVKVDCKPVYPRKALREGIEGKVTLLITVNERGIPEKVDVSKTSGSFDLDNAARAAMSRCVFVPQTVNGTPIKVTAPRDVTFNLKEG